MGERVMPEIGAPHKLTHQNGGNDEISLTGLSGLVGDSQTPLAHKTSHQDGGTDELSVAGLAGQVVFVPYNGKIADITHADTNKHTVDLATPLGETRTIIGGCFGGLRVSGTGALTIFPNEGITNAAWEFYTTTARLHLISAGTQRLQYALTVANDDFDLYCFGYIVIGA
jgi:hypothetical protein